MRSILLATFLIAALVPILPAASAHHCAQPAPDESHGTGITIPENPTGISGTLYPFVSANGVSVWVESGQEPGLQTTQGTCREANGNQGHYGRDCELASVGLDGAHADGDLCGILTLP